jgi:hypothetical protein
METEFPKFKLAKSIIGFVDSKGSGNEALIRMLESHTQMEFIKSNPLLKDSNFYIPSLDLSNFAEINLKNKDLKSLMKIIQDKNNFVVGFVFTPYNEEEFLNFLSKIKNEILQHKIEKRMVFLYPFGFVYPKSYEDLLNKFEKSLKEKMEVKLILNCHINQVAIKLSEFFKHKSDFVEENEIAEYLHKEDPYFQPHLLYYLYQNLLIHKNENKKNLYKWNKLTIVKTEDM